MKIFKLIISLMMLATSYSAFAQDRSANPGEDPNEAMVGDGAGVPNYGCPDPGKSCYKNLKHNRLFDNTKAIPASASQNKKENGGNNTGSSGTR